MKKNKQVIALLLSCIIFTGCTNNIMAPVITDEDNVHNSYKGPKANNEFLEIQEVPQKIENPLGVDEFENKEVKSLDYNNSSNEQQMNMKNNDAILTDVDLEQELAMLNLNNAEGNNAQSSVRKNFMPTDGTILNEFGDVVDGKKLTGINIAAKVGTQVLAVRSGIVIHAKYDKTYGNIVIIENKAQKIHMAYAHLQNIIVYEGEEIKVGQLIGKVGNSGSKATEPMLHFVIRQDKIPVDPLKYLNYKE